MRLGAGQTSPVAGEMLLQAVAESIGGRLEQTLVTDAQVALFSSWVTKPAGEIRGIQGHGPSPSGKRWFYQLPGMRCSAARCRDRRSPGRLGGDLSDFCQTSYDLSAGRARSTFSIGPAGCLNDRGASSCVRQANGRGPEHYAGLAGPVNIRR